MKKQKSDNTSGLFLDLMFIATDNIDFKVFLNDERLFATYLANDIVIESSHIDNQGNLALLLNFIFNTDVTLTEFADSANRKVYDLTLYKDTCIPIDDLERDYPAWIKENRRENTMDEYGNLVSIAGYIRRNHVKKHLLLTVEKKSIIRSIVVQCLEFYRSNYNLRVLLCKRD
ncbi:hypothetical protein ORI89_05415 [Sphingobacterium sp. UT-1RO-CII-1]|uniref:hypothetical protein n=1 Tax=Sphingobacterium sp. UT-1RO-CII-1 TaxID=2995225 RepID=UPI00227C2F7F|nr:hypothetical protein [Sphingobacterium sp. UT-1RO-CII-1]MCY4779078.1 hypothetical protein [Sphingobacterium sp. UT-1RO-CII-1]